MLDIPENIKDLFRADNTRAETAKNVKLRFYNENISLLFPDDYLFPSDDLFPTDMEPFLTIENSQINTESLSITESLCDSENIVFGQCNAAKVEITVADVTLDVTGKEFLFSIEVGGYELAMGIYRVESFIRLQADRRMRKITAYDRMQYFQKDVAPWYQKLTFPMTLKQFRASLCNHIGIEQVRIELPLDDMQITKTIEPQQLSGLDVLQSICEINGCFGSMEKTGRLKYVSLGMSGLYPAENLYPSDDLFPAEMLNAEHLSHYRQSNTAYEDYVVYGIDKVQIRQEEGDVGAIYGNGNNGYVIQGNFLVYGKSANELLQIAATVYDQIAGRIYRPAKIKCQALPWVEVGDGIICYTTDEIIETYCFKRTIQGIQAMTDLFEASGSQEQQEDFGIGTQIIQLEGKAAVIKRSVEEVSVRVTDLKNYTEAQFKITADQILAEVTRAKDAEAKLSIRADEIALSVTNLKNETESKFQITSEQILAEVSRAEEAEAALSIKADKIALSVTDLKENTEAQFKITSDQILSEVSRAEEAEQSIIKSTSEAIELKVSKGQVSSQLSIESDKVTISGNRLIVNSTNFKLDANGNANFSGKVEGASIKGGTLSGTDIQVGLLTADDDIVQIGGFESREAWGREIFQAYDQTTGMSADPSKRGQLHMWAGWHSDTDYALVVNNRKEVHCYEVYIESNKNFWKGWNLSDSMKDLYDKIQRAEDAINELRDQIDSIG